MAKPCALELRERAVAAVIAEGRSQKEVARLFAVSKATLDRWLLRWRLGESLAAKTGKPGPACRAWMRPPAPGPKRSWPPSRTRGWATTSTPGEGPGGGSP